MDTFLQPFEGLAEYEEIRKKLKTETGIVQVSGCVESQKAQFAYGMADLAPMKLVVAENDLKARQFYEDYRFYDDNVVLFPSRDLIFYQADVHGNLITRQRMQALRAILEKRELTVVTSVAGCMEALVPVELLADAVVTVDFDNPVNLDALTEKLVYMGYERVARVEMPGQFSIRGGILDLFSLTEENPWRVELFDDEVDSIRSFEAGSQRSIESLERIEIYPAAEMILTKDLLEAGLSRLKAETESCVKAFRDRFQTEEGARLAESVKDACARMNDFQDFSGMETYLRYFFPDAVPFVEYFAQNALVFLDEPNRIVECAKVTEEEFRESMIHRLEGGYALPGQTQLLMEYKKVLQLFNSRRALSLSAMEPHNGDWRFTARYRLSVQSVSPYNNSFELLVKDLKRYKRTGYQTVLLSASRTRAMRLSEDLQAEGLNSFYSEDRTRVVRPGEILVCGGHAHRGFEYPMLKFILITDTDIFGREKKKKKKKSEYSGRKIQDFAELHVGDYVVHENHGLGVYRGIEKVTVDRVVKDYIKIEYAGKSSLYILATQLDALQKYAGADAKKPALNKLGGQEWKRTKTRVRSAVKNIARELVALYAARRDKNGYIYGPDTVWQREFEEMFPFEETEDQIRAIEDTKRDMESPRIMDRLICGDVGYGKTEIAIRAAFKAVQENRQVVYLVPTTILAQQHYNTFVQRMKDFPVEIDLLCRFRTPAEQKKTVERLKKGLSDIVIGTHRVLSADVQFKNLGLLIIDEEQRFGVTHKEKIKQMKQTVDVLTLTATPIPRTLHMSLIGIRDMSVLEEPPLDRVPIQTYVMEYNPEMVREAINRELARGGQVYYVYNRVNNIDEITNEVAALAPEASVAFAHGQMSERELERIMYGFITGEIDVLVSTTIIETGLDISNVNTIIIHDSDNMGLSQLYQLRGRVGRSNRTAYAFLMYRKYKMLKDVAEKRLHAIREFTDLGSGFKIAMRDLEIRGAGNLLGAEQHGHMEAVGYDLFCKMLNEAVREEKGEAAVEDFETTIDLDMDAYIPETYIPDEYQKLDIYKRIATISSEEDYDDMLEELLDRFGEPPRAVQNLLSIARLKAMAHRLYMTEVKQRGQEIRLGMYERARVDVAKIPEVLKNHVGTLVFKTDGPAPYFVFQAGKRGKADRRTAGEKLKELLEEMTVLVA